MLSCRVRSNNVNIYGLEVGSRPYKHLAHFPMERMMQDLSRGREVLISRTCLPYMGDIRYATLKNKARKRKGSFSLLSTVWVLGRKCPPFLLL